MKKSFLKQVCDRQQFQHLVPSNKIISEWALTLLNIIYPERNELVFDDEEDLARQLLVLEAKLEQILSTAKGCAGQCDENSSVAFFKTLPEIYRKLNNDVKAILDGDPAAVDAFEIIRCYPGFFAIALYRIAHELYLLGVPYLPRILTEYAHSKTGIDIHPAAKIGEFFYIDHGTGIVIGETSVIGEHVKLYQGVTLGALSVEKALSSVKRHPTIGNHVIIYSGATILGGQTHIGDHAVVGGNVWLTKSIPAGSRVYHQATIKISETEKTS